MNFDASKQVDYDCNEFEKGVEISYVDNDMFVPGYG